LSPIFGKKLAFFSKTDVMIKSFHNLALFCVKNANFFADFLAKIFLKSIRSIPGQGLSLTLESKIRGFSTWHSIGAGSEDVYSRAAQGHGDLGSML
jgi:hypothetical protein